MTSTVFSPKLNVRRVETVMTAGFFSLRASDDASSDGRRPLARGTAWLEQLQPGVKQCLLCIERASIGGAATRDKLRKRNLTVYGPRSHELQIDLLVRLLN